MDMIAERIVQLGGIAEGTARVAASRSQLEEYPLAIASRAVDKCRASLAGTLGDPCHPLRHPVE